MGVMASQITSPTIVNLTVYSGVDKHQSSASLAFMRGIHRRPMNSLRKWPVTRKMFPFDEVIIWSKMCLYGYKRDAIIVVRTDVLVPGGARSSEGSLLVTNIDGILSKLLRFLNISITLSLVSWSDHIRQNGLPDVAKSYQYALYLRFVCLLHTLK